MRELKFLFVPLGLAVLLAASPVQADIRVTLSDGNPADTETLTSTGPAFFNTFGVGNYKFTVQTAFVTTPTPNGGTGELEATSIVGSTTGTGTLADLKVTIEDVINTGTAANPQYVPETFGPTSSTMYQVQNSASLTSPVPTPVKLELTGAAQLDLTNPNDTSYTGNNNVAPVDFALAPGSSSGSETTNGRPTQAGGYTLAQTYTLSGVSGGTSGLTIGFNTSVTPQFTPAAVPEPSSIVLTGLTAVGIGGFVLRRRIRTRSV